MTAILLRSANIGTATVSHSNQSISVGDQFRLVGRSTAYRAVRVFEQDALGTMVVGVSRCGRFRTVARVCDTLVA